MHLVILALVSFVESTYIRKWNLGGCGDSVSERCNSLPSGQCCYAGRPSGGSVKIANLPDYSDLAIPYNGNRAAQMMGDNEEGYCSDPRVEDVQLGDLFCLSRNAVGTGTWISCRSQSFFDRCLEKIGISSRDLGNETISELPDQGDIGYIDDYEASLPTKSYHDAYGNEISFEEYNRLADEENDREINGTLHEMYPDLYENPNRKRQESVYITAYSSEECRGESLGVVTQENVCVNAANGAGIYTASLPDNCIVQVYQGPNCGGDMIRAVGNGAPQGCYDGGNFNSLSVVCGP